MSPQKRLIYKRCVSISVFVLCALQILAVCTAWWIFGVGLTATIIGTFAFLTIALIGELLAV